MKKDLKFWFFWAGIVIVAGSHIYMLFAGLKPEEVVPHSIANIVAAGLFAYNRFG